MSDHMTPWEQLRDAFGPKAARSVARRLTRVPLVAAALQNPALLSAALDADPDELTPGWLARRSLDIEAATDSETEMDALHQLQAVAREAVGLSSEAQQAGPHVLIEEVKANPRSARSSVACALVDGNMEQILPTLLKEDEPVIRRVALNALLAAASPEAAAEVLLQMPGVDPTTMLADLVGDREIDAAAALAEAVLQSFEVGPKGTPTGPHDPTLASLVKRATGDSEGARQAAEQAWEDASAHLAGAADQLAELAEDMGDPVLAAEARQRALASGPTALRRAEAALSMVALGDADGARRLLAEPPQSDEESIASAKVYLATARTELAANALSEADERSHGLGRTWLLRLTDAWIELGQTDRALAAIRAGLEARPGDLAVRARLAELCLASGDAAAAVEQAALLLAADESGDRRRMLARALQESGQPEQALPQWLEVAKTDPSAKGRVVETALASDDVSTALAFAQQMLEHSPESIDGRIAMGKSLIAAGNHAAGQAHLQRAVEAAPNQPSVWLALADSQKATSSSDNAAATLESATQACPDSPEIHAAHAAWLAESGQWTDALHAIEQARALDPENPAWMSQHGIYLRRLGRHEGCQAALEAAIAARPSDWEGRVALAESYAATEKPDKALALLADLPPAAPATARALLAKVTLESAGREDRPAGERALALLEAAKTQGYRSEDLDYWFGRALHSSGQPADAIKAYQSCIKGLPEGAHGLHQMCLRGEAEAAITTDQIPLAISVLERARDAGDNEALTLNLLSSAYLIAGLADEAYEPALAACEVDPGNPQVQRQFIEAATAAGQLEPALDKVRGWTQEDPRADLLLSEADLLYLLGESAEARQSIGKAIAVNRRNVSVLRSAATRLMDHGEPGSAARILNAAERLSPDAADLIHQQAIAADMAGDFERTRLAWSRLLELDPESIDALVGAAQSHWKSDQRTAAIGFLQRAVNLAPDRAPLQAELARRQLANGETVQALTHFRTAVELTPDDERLTLEVAQAFLDNNAPAEALEVLSATGGSEPGTEWSTTVAEAYLELGRPADASLELRRLPQPVSNPIVACQLALAEAEQSHVEAAEDWLSKATALPVLTAKQAVWLARTAVRLGRWQSALEAFHAVDPTELDEQASLAKWIAATRVADARWLFAEAGALSSHAPAPSAVDDDQRRACEKMIDAIAEAGTPRSMVDALGQRVALAFGGSPSDEGFDPSSLPNSPRLRMHAAEGHAMAALRAHDPAGAVRTLTEARDAVHVGRWGALIAGLAHTEMQNFTMARKAFGAAANDPLLRPLAAFLAGQAFAEQGKTGDAINSINTAVLAWPDEPRWQHRLAELYMADHHPATALPHLQQALELAPGSPDLQLDLARALRSAGQISEAHQAFNQALAQFPDDAAVLLEAAEVDLAAGHPQLAGDRFQRALETQPKNAAARVGAARAALALGDQRAAEKHANAALRTNPMEPHVLLALGDVLSEQGKLEQALAMYDDARDHGDCSPQVELARAQILLKSGRTRDAIESLDAIVSAEPDNDPAWSALAEAYGAANQPGQAIDAIRLALDIRPGKPAYRLQLARYFRATGQLDQSLAELAELENAAPQDHNVAFETGCVHQARRQFEKALHAFERAISLRSDDASAHYQAGLVLKSLKAYGRAADMFQRAVELNPEDSDALHQLAAVQALALVHGNFNASAVTP